MGYDPKKHHRTSIRLTGWDYSWPASYHVTIVVKPRLHVFGKVVHDHIILSRLGAVADDFWRQIPDHHSNVILDVHQIMPDHLHGIVVLKGDTSSDPDVQSSGTDVQLNVRTSEDGLNVRMPGGRKKAGKSISPAKDSLSVVIRTYKGAVTTWAHDNGYPSFSWLGRFHDHIIRDDEDLERVRAYIRNNPLNWSLDPRKRSRRR